MMGGGLSQTVNACEQLQGFVSFGIPVQIGITTISKSRVYGSFNKRWSQLSEAISMGMGFSQAVNHFLLSKRHAIPFALSHNQLPAAVQLALSTQYLRERKSCHDALKEKTRYPMVLALCLAGLLLLAITWVLPNSMDLFIRSGQSVPPALTWFSRHLNLGVYLTTAMLIIVGFVCVKGWQSLFSMSHRDLVWGIAYLMKEGLSLKEAISGVSPLGSGRLSQQWGCFMQAMHECPDFYKNWVSSFTMTGEEKRILYMLNVSDQTEGLLIKLAATLYQSHLERIKRIIAMVQPLCLVAAGLVIMLVLYLNYLPVIALIKID
jgi:type II secretory pathway component PulF